MFIQICRCFGFVHFDSDSVSAHVIINPDDMLVIHLFLLGLFVWQEMEKWAAVFLLVSSFTEFHPQKGHKYT